MGTNIIIIVFFLVLRLFIAFKHPSTVQNKVTFMNGGNHRFIKKRVMTKLHYEVNLLTTPLSHSTISSFIDTCNIFITLVLDPIKVQISSVNIPIDISVYDSKELDTFQSFLPSSSLPQSELSAISTLSSSDTLSISLPKTDTLLLPNNKIKPLDGGYNLGIILWSLVIYFGGPIPSEQSLSDRILPIIFQFIQIFNSNNSNSTSNSNDDNSQQQFLTEDLQWYKDYLDGYTFQCPLYIDFIRLIIIGTAGYVFNNYLIQTLGEGTDVYWGWATAMSTCFPTLLIVWSRKKRVSREMGEFESEIKINFREFRENCLIRKKGSGLKCNEDAIISAYYRVYINQQKPVVYNDKKSSLGNTESSRKEMTDKLLIRCIRQWYGSRPDLDGNFMDLQLLPYASSVTTTTTTTTTTTDLNQSSNSIQPTLIIKSKDDDRNGLNNNNTKTTNTNTTNNTNKSSNNKELINDKDDIKKPTPGNPFG